MEPDKTYTAFTCLSRIGGGDLETTVRDTWAYIQDHPEANVQVFDDRTGHGVDLDLRGGLDEAMARVVPPKNKKGPGRPALGVVCREVCLMPRHWEWLDEQTLSASAVIRRLIEAARKETSSDMARKRALEAAGRFMWAVAGDLVGFEEASRALYAERWPIFDRLVEPWAADVREQLAKMTTDVRGE